MKKYPKIGDTIYHKDVCDYKEQLIVLYLDVVDEKIKVYGCFSRETDDINQSKWISVDGWSYIQDYRVKKHIHDFALKIKILTEPITKAEIDKNNELLMAKNYILHLTREIVE